MKEIIKRNIFGFVIGFMMATTISVSAAVLVEAKLVSLSSSKTSHDNVQDALDELYDKSNIGNATEEEILDSKEALVNGNKVTGSMPDQGSWNSKPSSSGKVSIPEGYHNGSGYVDTSDVYKKGYDDGENVGEVICEQEKACSYADGTMLHSSSSSSEAIFTIPCSGTYRIDYAGAAGGKGGNARQENAAWTIHIGGTGSSSTIYNSSVDFAKGDLITYIVGSMGGNGSGVNQGSGGSPGGKEGSRGYLTSGMLDSAGGVAVEVTH